MIAPGTARTVDVGQLYRSLPGHHEPVSVRLFQAAVVIMVFGRLALAIGTMLKYG